MKSAERKRERYTAAKEQRKLSSPSTLNRKESRKFHIKRKRQNKGRDLENLAIMYDNCEEKEKKEFPSFPRLWSKIVEDITWGGGGVLALAHYKQELVHFLHVAHLLQKIALVIISVKASSKPDCLLH